MRKVPRIGGLPLLSVGAGHLNAFDADLLADGRRNGAGGPSPATVERIDATIHKAMADAVRRGRRCIRSGSHLRHSYVTAPLAEGVPLKVASQRVGTDESVRRSTPEVQRCDRVFPYCIGEDDCGGDVIFRPWPGSCLSR